MGQPEGLSVVRWTFLIVFGGILCAAVSGGPTVERAEGSVNEGHFAEDDSDMLMEPNEFQPSFGAAVAASAADTAATASRHEYYPAIVDDDEDDTEFRPALVDTTEYEHHHHQSQRHRAAAATQQRGPPSGGPALVRHHRKPAASYDITTPSAQSFLPSFFRDTVPPLGHSRPYFAGPPPQHPAQAIRSVAGGHELPTSIAPPSYDQTILGSGDFGVIRGGTFYQENDPPVRAPLESNDYYHFYKSGGGNGHGRPQSAAYTSAGGGRPQQLRQHGGGYGAFGGGGSAEEQFSNFRDFADINAPSDPAYSQFVVVYANKNASEAAAAGGHAGAGAGEQMAEQQAVKPQRRPQNIFEQLELLDREQPERYEVRVAKPLKPKSFKAKLAKTKLEKKYVKKLIGSVNGAPKDHEDEPLMALS